MASCWAEIKPSSLTGEPTTGGQVGETGTVFYLRVKDIRENFSTKLSNATAGDDSNHMVQGNGYLEGQLELSGFMISADALGIKNLVDCSVNPCEVTIGFGSDYTQSLKIYFSDVQISWAKEGAFALVQLSGELTDTDPTTIETASGVV